MYANPVLRIPMVMIAAHACSEIGPSGQSAIAPGNKTIAAANWLPVAMASELIPCRYFLV